MKKSYLDKLAVCSWSMQPMTQEELFAKTRETGLRHLQIALDPIRENPGYWTDFGERAAQQGLTLASGMFGCVGEDYTTMETIRRTGGIVPDATWQKNWENILNNVTLAKKLGLSLVTFHAGFLPHDPAEPGFDTLLVRLRLVADVFAAEGIDLALETGQETADVLAVFLRQLQRTSVGVNFDPANMILYDRGNPIHALRTLGPWLKQCHIKDARKTKVPGTWGEEVTTGTGEVDWTAFFDTLDNLGYSGWCCIEREAGDQRVADIRAGREFLESMAR